MAMVSGKAVKAGDKVKFECGTVQSGTIVAIHRSMLDLYNDDGFEGPGLHTGQRTTTKDASECWIDEEATV